MTKVMSSSGFRGSHPNINPIGKTNRKVPYKYPFLKFAPAAARDQVNKRKLYIYIYIYVCIYIYCLDL